MAFDRHYDAKHANHLPPFEAATDPIDVTGAPVSGWYLEHKLTAAPESSSFDGCLGLAPVAGRWLFSGGP